MNLHEAHIAYGWPAEQRVLRPSGGGPAHFAATANAKIGVPLSRKAEREIGGTGLEIRTGLLCPNPESDRTEAPLAIICEFSGHANVATLREAHRLAWNFSHAPLLITLEPSRVLVWSCSVRPLEGKSEEEWFDSTTADLADRLVSCEITRADDPLSGLTKASSVEIGAIHALHWVNLLSGHFFQTHPHAFKPTGRLDATLISNLQFVREHLHAQLGLSEKRCHDLLARLIFVQFLFQRKDSKGRAALHADRLRNLAKEGILNHTYQELPELLANYEDTYRLFQWLNDRFNGDLFPGKGETERERTNEWLDEKAEVKPIHLEYLSRFISGREDPNGQRLLWRYYAFDVIPLELISSIYELFVGPAKKDKAYYTRGHLVDFMLDAVLPWQSPHCDLKILDPSCGSGIFLVKVFQRLVHRWKVRHGADPKPSELRTILQTQIFGTDINPEAIRVASFSLYLAFCDELDPRHYWSKDKLFPRLRERNLIDRDFFKDTTPVHTDSDAQTYDLVIGNAPWGKSSAKDDRSEAALWAKRNGWTVPGKDHGSVFLAKAARLTRPDGWVSMIQPGGLLLNRMGPAQKFRKRLFNDFSFEEVINLAAIRRELFAKAIGPSCIATFQPKPPQPGADFAYVTPKPQATVNDGIRILIEPHDIHFVSQVVAASDDLVWSVLMWGGRRDLELIRRLSRGETIGKLRASGRLATREGVIRGNRKKEQMEIIGRRFLSETEFPSGAFLEIDARDLIINEDPETDGAASVNFEAFDTPQLLFKQSWRAEKARFESVLVNADNTGRGVLCSDSYVSVRDLSGRDDILAGLWTTLRSTFATYWFALSGGKFAGFVPTATESEFRRLPALSLPKGKLLDLAAKGNPAIDKAVFDLLSLAPAERILVEDLHEVVLPDAQRQGGDPPGYKSVPPNELESYAQTFLKVMGATYGEDTPICSTIFLPPSGNSLPVQLVAIHLGWEGHAPVELQKIETQELLEILDNCHKQIIGQKFDGIAYQRVVEVVSTIQSAKGPVPTLFLIKPTQRRYWLRSLAMRDADRLGSLVAGLNFSER